MASKLCMNVDGTGYRDLTQAEQKILSVALENYRKNRAAQGKLDEHKQKTDEDCAEIRARYDKVLRAIQTIQECV